jgi:MFS family permease
MVYHSTQSALPKVLELRQDGLLQSGTLGVGVLIGAIYTAAGVMQVLGGHMADRLPLKLVYVGITALQIPLLWWAASATGLGLVLVATVMVMAAAGALPAENMLLARYAAARHHGLAFGLKFVLAFGAGPLAIQFVANVNRQTGEFAWVFLVLAMLAAVAACCALLLPGQRNTQVGGPITAKS